MAKLKESNDTVEIKGDLLKELKKELSPLTNNKKISNKDDIVKVITENFSDKIIVKKMKSKYILVYRSDNIFAIKGINF
jgi:hypothetical protein